MNVFSVRLNPPSRLGETLVEAFWKLFASKASNRCNVLRPISASALSLRSPASGLQRYRSEGAILSGMEVTRKSPLESWVDGARLAKQDKTARLLIVDHGCSWLLIGDKTGSNAIKQAG